MNTDQLALETAIEILELLTQPMLQSQLKAKIQCVIIELLENQNEQP